MIATVQPHAISTTPSASSADHDHAQSTPKGHCIMSFLIILIAATTVASLFRRRLATAREHARRGLALAMVIAGASHFANSEPFVQHLPEWVPGREQLVYATGAVEVLFGLALLRYSSAPRTVGRLLAIYLVAVLPANIYVAVADVDVVGQAGGLFAWIRLPLQALFIYWALWSTTTPSPRQPSSATTAERLATTP
jgi:uncharacterized membrane protein